MDKIKLKLKNRRREKCLVCGEWKVVSIMELGGSSIIISYSNRGINYKCLNCGAEYE